MILECLCIAVRIHHPNIHPNPRKFYHLLCIQVGNHHSCNQSIQLFNLFAVVYFWLNNTLKVHKTMHKSQCAHALLRMHCHNACAGWWFVTTLWKLFWVHWTSVDLSMLPFEALRNNLGNCVGSTKHTFLFNGKNKRNVQRKSYINQSLNHGQSFSARQTQWYNTLQTTITVTAVCYIYCICIMVCTYV